MCTENTLPRIHCYLLANGAADESCSTRLFNLWERMRVRYSDALRNTAITHFAIVAQTDINVVAKTNTIANNNDGINGYIQFDIRMVNQCAADAHRKLKRNESTCIWEEVNRFNWVMGYFIGTSMNNGSLSTVQFNIEMQ